MIRRKGKKNCLLKGRDGQKENVQRERRRHTGLRRERDGVLSSVLSKLFHKKVKEIIKICHLKIYRGRGMVLLSKLSFVFNKKLNIHLL